MEQGRPKIGIGVIVRRGDKILLGERLHGHGSNTYTIPGGHLEFGESFEETARREVEEETGLKNIVIKGLKVLSRLEMTFTTINTTCQSASLQNH